MRILKRLLQAPAPDRFARRVMRALRDAGETKQIVYEADRFRLVFLEEGKKTGEAALRNLYGEFCQRDRGERKDFLKRIVRALLAHKKEIPADFDDARHDLLPVVRSRAYYTYVELKARMDGTAFCCPYQPIGDRLALGVVYDLPEAMVTVQDNQLEEWDTTYYECLEVARHNLSQLDFSFARLGHDVYVSTTGDNYDASRLIMADFFHSLDLDGEPIAMLPNRDKLLVAGSHNEDGLRLMAREALQEPRPLDGAAFCLRGEEWVSWLPSTDHPCHRQFKRLNVQSIGEVYADQKELLDELHSRVNVSVHVAPFAGLQNQETGEIRSYCVWPDKGPALLPKTDQVLFRTERGQQRHDLAAASWTRVREVVGHLMQPQDVFPVRFRVEDFPTAEQLAEIGGS